MKFANSVRSFKFHVDTNICSHRLLYLFVNDFHNNLKMLARGAVRTGKVNDVRSVFFSYS